MTKKKAPIAPASDGVMSSAALMGKHYEHYGFFGEAKTLLGNPQVGASIMLHGEPGHGKSSLALRLATYFAKWHGDVLYVSSEQFDSASLQANLKRAGGAVKGLDFGQKMPNDATLNRYKLLVVDSVANIGLKIEQFQALHQKHPELAVILVQQVTKQGKARGSNEWPHEVDVTVCVTDGLAVAEKNRFAPLSSIVVFRK